MNLFKSPTRRRIEKRIEEIILLKAENVVRRNGKSHNMKAMSLSTLEMVHLDIELKALEKLIRK